MKITQSTTFVKEGEAALGIGQKWLKLKTSAMQRKYGNVDLIIVFGGVFEPRGVVRFPMFQGKKYLKWRKWGTWVALESTDAECLFVLDSESSEVLESYSSHQWLHVEDSESSMAIPFQESVISLSYKSKYKKLVLEVWRNDRWQTEIYRLDENDRCLVRVNSDIPFRTKRLNIKFENFRSATYK